MLNQHLRGKKAIGDVWARRYEEFMKVPVGHLDGHPKGVSDPVATEAEEFAEYDATTLDVVGELAERLETLLGLTWVNRAAMLSRMSDRDRESYMMECHSLARRIVGKCHGVVFEEIVRS